MIKNNSQKYIGVFAIVLIVIATVHYLKPNNKFVDILSTETCLKLGEIRKSEYSNSKWWNLNFGRSCSDNIFYSNPYDR